MVIERTDRLANIFKAAAASGTLIPAFNSPYIPVVEAIVKGLADNDTFGLVEVSRIEIMKFGAKSVTATAEEYHKCADTRCTCLHLDHIPVIDEDGLRVDWKSYIAEGIESGYDSVMIDGSRLPFEENIEVVAEVVAMAHPAGVLVEAELGSVLGHESGPLPPYEELFASRAGFTDPDQAREFVRKTGVDWLSVSVGSIHGAISGAAMHQAKVPAKLDIEHLKKLREATGVPLVLHGGSGVQQAYVDEAIRHGLTKINIGNDIRLPYDKVIADGGTIAEARAAVTARITYLIRNVYKIEGSASRLSAA